MTQTANKTMDEREFPNLNPKPAHQPLAYLYSRFIRGTTMPQTFEQLKISPIKPILAF